MEAALIFFSYQRLDIVLLFSRSHALRGNACIDALRRILDKDKTVQKTSKHRMNYTGF